MPINSGSTPRSKKRQTGNSYLAQAKKLLRDTTKTRYTGSQMPPLMVKDFDRELCELIMDYPDPTYMDVRRAVVYTCRFDLDNIPNIVKKFVNNKEIFTLEAWDQVFTFAVPDTNLPEYIDATSDAISANTTVDTAELQWLLRFALLDIQDAVYESIGRPVLLKHYITLFDHSDFKIDTIFRNIFYEDKSLSTNFMDRQEGIFLEAMQKSKRNSELLGFVFGATGNIKCMSADAVDIFCF